LSLIAGATAGDRTKRSADELVRQIEELREPIEKTLLDIREMISALDNPLVGVMEEPAKPADARPKQAEQESGAWEGAGTSAQPSRQAKLQKEQPPPPPMTQIPITPSSDVSRFNATAIASLAVWLLGKSGFERLLNSMELGVGGGIYLRSLLREAGEFVASSLRDDPPAHPVGLGHEAYLLCVMLLELFCSNPSQPTIGMLASMIQRLLSQNGVRRV